MLVFIFIKVYSGLECHGHKFELLLNFFIRIWTGKKVGGRKTLSLTNTHIHIICYAQTELVF
jgi:hypothetical protein